jgi:hypothetical protein
MGVAPRRPSLSVGGWGGKGARDWTARPEPLVCRRQAKGDEP